MKLSISYDSLVSNLDYVSKIVEDNSLEESLRNIIFKIDNSKVTVMGYNSLATCRTHIQSGDFRLELTEEEKEKPFTFQVKAKELNNFLSTFKSLKRTKVDNLEFFNRDRKIILKVYEVAVESDRAYLNKESEWGFDNMPVMAQVLNELNKEIDLSQGTPMFSIELLKYIKALLPIISNEAGNALPSKLHFSDEYLCVVPSMFVTLYKNELSDIFKNIVLTYSALNFMQKVLENNETITVARTEEQLIIATDTSEALIRYSIRMPDINLYAKNIVRDNLIMLDRLYLKDVLKRLLVLNEDITIRIDRESNKFEISNSKFKQPIEMLKQRGLESFEGEIVFKLPLDILNKAIIGDDTLYSENLGIYISKNSMGYTLVFTDDRGKWFSIMQVR